MAHVRGRELYGMQSFRTGQVGNRIYEGCETQSVRGQQGRKKPENANSCQFEGGQGSIRSLLHGLSRARRSSYRRSVCIEDDASSPVAHFAGRAVVHRWAVAMDHRERGCAIGNARLEGNSQQRRNLEHRSVSPAPASGR